MRARAVVPFVIAAVVWVHACSEAPEARVCEPGRSIS